MYKEFQRIKGGAKRPVADGATVDPKRAKVSKSFQGRIELFQALFDKFYPPPSV